MSFACRGVTHCSKCGKTLKMSEFSICKSCEEKSSLSINAYQKYKIKRKVDCAYIDVENSTPNDIFFKNLKGEDETLIDGGTFLEYLVKLLDDRYISEFEIRQNTIKIEHFNPLNGESNLTYIEISRR